MLPPQVVSHLLTSSPKWGSNRRSFLKSDFLMLSKEKKTRFSPINSKCYHRLTRNHSVPFWPIFCWTLAPFQWLLDISIEWVLAWGFFCMQTTAIVCCHGRFKFSQRVEERENVWSTQNENSVKPYQIVRDIWEALTCSWYFVCSWVVTLTDRDIRTSGIVILLWILMDRTVIIHR